MRKAVSTVVLVFGLLLGAASGYGQVSVLDDFNPLSATSPGVHLYGVTMSSNYSSGLNTGSGLPFGSLSGQGSDILATQGSATFGWATQGPYSSMSVTYSPSYVRGFGRQRYHSLDQTLTISGNRKLNSKWSVHGSIHAMVANFDELLFGPTLYGNLSGASATLDELAGGVMTRSSDNPSLQSILGTVPVVNTPETSFLYGGREFSAATDISLEYAWSSRSSFHLSFDGNRTQFLNSGNAGNLGPVPVLPATTGVGSTLGWTYALSPRTTTSVTLSSFRTISRYQDGYSTQGNISLGRTLSTRWFVQGMVGMGWITDTRETFAKQRNNQYELSGSVGYKLSSNTFLGTFSRTVSDVYGLGADATESSNAAWTWMRPGGNVSLNSTFGYSRLIGPAFPNAGSWTANAGISRVLGAHTTARLSGVYATYPQFVTLMAHNLSERGVMLTLSWSPSERRQQQ